ncbi:MAG: hypothetical protein ACFFCW_00490 [Candidatus Hodarchaeota archaeon]
MKKYLTFLQSILFITIAFVYLGCESKQTEKAIVRNEQLPQSQNMLADIRKEQSQQYQKIPADSQNLQIGMFYQISKDTPLMPEFEPIDPLVAIKKIRTVPANSIIKIISKREKRTTPWYYIQFGQQKGWINSIALIGQNIIKVDKQ